jgi:hypothetical protein
MQELSMLPHDSVQTLDEPSEVRPIEGVLDVRSVRLEPLLGDEIIHGNRSFVLHKPIQIRIDCQDGIWIHEYEPLGILSYAPSRAESLDAFRMDFAACWDLVAQESDEKLTADARELKRKLLNLVKKVENLS